MSTPICSTCGGAHSWERCLYSPTALGGRPPRCVLVPIPEDPALLDEPTTDHDFATVRQALATCSTIEADERAGAALDRIRADMTAWAKRGDDAEALVETMRPELVRLERRNRELEERLAKIREIAR